MKKLIIVCAFLAMLTAVVSCDSDSIDKMFKGETAQVVQLSK